MSTNTIRIPQQATTFQYDFLGRKIATNNPDSGSGVYLYDNSSLVRFFQDDVAKAKGYINYIKYDQLGRIIEDGYYNTAWDSNKLQNYACNDPSWPSSNTWSHRYIYNGNDTTPNMIGNLWQSYAYNNAPEDVIESFSYNRLNNVLSSSRIVKNYSTSKEYIINYSYSCIGRHLTTTDNITELTISKFYNSLGQLINIISNKGNITNNLANFAYDQEGRIENATILPLNNGNSPLIERQYTYNSRWVDTIKDNNLIEKLQYTQGSCNKKGYYSGVIANQSFQYNTGEQATDQYCFTADYLKRILTANNQSETNSWKMDDNSNFITHTKNSVIKTYTLVENKNQLYSVIASDGSINNIYTYSENGGIFSISSNNTTLMQFSYYDGNGLPQIINLPSNASLDTVFLEYSPDNKRTLKTTSLKENTVSQRLYIHGCSSMPALEIDKSNNIEQVKRYIYIPGVTIIFYEDEFYFISKDHLGSTRSIINQSNNIIGQYNYDIYGVPTIIKSPEFEFDYLYTFQEYDKELGLYNYKVRLYDPSIGCFLMADPASQFFSPYVYVGNNPTISTDSTGAMSDLAICGVVFGTILGVVATVATGGAAAVALGPGLASAVAAGAVAGLAGSATSYSTNAAFNRKFSGKDFGISLAEGVVGGMAGGLAGGVAGNLTMRGAQALEWSIPNITKAGIASSTVIGGAVGSMAATGVGSAVYNQAYFSKSNGINMAISIGIGATVGAGAGLLGAGAYAGGLVPGRPTLPLFGDQNTNLELAAFDTVNKDQYRAIAFANDDITGSLVQHMQEQVQQKNLDVLTANRVICDVVATHGIARNFVPDVQGGYRQFISPEDFAVTLKNNGFGQNPIKLISCFSSWLGRFSAAQGLANALRVTVYASPDGIVNPGNAVGYEIKGWQPPNDWIQFNPRA